MKTVFNLPEYRTVHYELNPETGYYTRQEIPASISALTGLPFELREEQARHEKIRRNAKVLILSRTRFKNGTYEFITGLKERHFENWFVGNDFERRNGKKTISLVVFHFGERSTHLTIYYFTGYDEGKTKLRLTFVNDAIPCLLNPQQSGNKREDKSSLVFNFSNTNGGTRL